MKGISATLTNCKNSMKENFGEKEEKQREKNFYIFKLIAFDSFICFFFIDFII